MTDQGQLYRSACSRTRPTNAKIERFWRSLKSLLFGLVPPQFQSEDRGLVVNRALAHYSNRPHEALGGATPTDRYQQAVAAHRAALVLIAHLRDANRLLGSRLARLPERRRPFYTPVERFQILSLKEQMGLSNAETAQVFRLSPGTISRWMTHADPESETVGSLVKPIPPVR